jgi:hypothetical protein
VRLSDGGNGKNMNGKKMTAIQPQADPHVLANHLLAIDSTRLCETAQSRAGQLPAQPACRTGTRESVRTQEMAKK